MITAALLPLVGFALAADPAPAIEGEAAPTRVTRERAERDVEFEIGFRGRRLTVPRGLFDIWYHDEDTPGWPLPGQERPFVNGYSYGLEFGFKKRSTNAQVWVDWIDSNMPEGYWDDREETVGGTLDGDYIRPAGNLGIFSFGADVAYEVDMIRLDMTNQAFGMSMLVGGGLGLGVLIGELEEWSKSDDEVPSYVQYENGDPATSEKKVPRVYPMVDINLALRLNFGNRVVLRLEGGLHTLLYYGAALGFRF